MRLRSHSMVITALVASLLVGGGVGALLAGSGGSTRTTAVAAAGGGTVSTIYRTRVRTVTRIRVRTVTAPGASPGAVGTTRGKAGPRSNPAGLPGSGLGSVPGAPPYGAPAGRSPVVPATPPGPPQNFAGAGGKALGTITIQGTATLRWTNSSGRFTILFNGGSVGVDSTGRSGSMVAPAGTYRQVDVQSPGHWTIHIG